MTSSVSAPYRASTNAAPPCSVHAEMQPAPGIAKRSMYTTPTTPRQATTACARDLCTSARYFILNTTISSARNTVLSRARCVPRPPVASAQREDRMAGNVMEPGMATSSAYVTHALYAYSLRTPSSGHLFHVQRTARHTPTHCAPMASQHAKAPTYSESSSVARCANASSSGVPACCGVRRRTGSRNATGGSTPTMTAHSSATSSLRRAGDDLSALSLIFFRDSCRLSRCFCAACAFFFIFSCILARSASAPWRRSWSSPARALPRPRFLRPLRTSSTRLRRASSTTTLAPPQNISREKASRMTGSVRSTSVRPPGCHRAPTSTAHGNANAAQYRCVSSPKNVCGRTRQPGSGSFAFTARASAMSTRRR